MILIRRCSANVELEAPNLADTATGGSGQVRAARKLDFRFQLCISGYNTNSAIAEYAHHALEVTDRQSLQSSIHR